MEKCAKSSNILSVSNKMCLLSPTVVLHHVVSSVVVHHVS